MGLIREHIVRASPENDREASMMVLINKYCVFCLNTMNVFRNKLMLGAFMLRNKMQFEKIYTIITSVTTRIKYGRGVEYKILRIYKIIK